MACGDGSLVAVDAASGEPLWAHKVSAAAVRTLHVGAGSVLAAGDDGAVRSLRW